MGSAAVVREVGVGDCSGKGRGVGGAGGSVAAHEVGGAWVPAGGGPLRLVCAESAPAYEANRAVRDGAGDAHARAGETPEAEPLDAEPIANAHPSPDALDDLSDEIVTLAAHIHAATHQLLVLIARFDRWRGWAVGGHRSCAHWLAVRTGIALGAAREKVRAAHALERLPEINASMARGELSFSKVRALTRAATPENETVLLEFARSTTTEGLERLVRGWKKLSRLDEQELEAERHRSRCFSVFQDDEGMYVVRGRLDPEVGALLMRAVEAAGDALFAKDTRETAALRTALGMDEPPELQTTPTQRRADALGLLAERALAAAFGGAGGGEPQDAERGEDDNAAPAPLSGTRAERYQVVLYVDPETLSASGEPARSELEDGTRVSAETSRRLACDTAVVTLVEGESGLMEGKDGLVPGNNHTTRRPADLVHRSHTPILDVGRKRRTIPPAIRRALEARDRGCRFPGCGLRFTDAHHVKHWADGGDTGLHNLVLLCRHHHRAVHEEGFRVEFGPGGRPNFYTPRGIPLPEVPAAARTGEDPVAALIRRNRLRGIEPAYNTAGARYEREDDVPWAVTAAAREAIDPWE